MRQYELLKIKAVSKDKAKTLNLIAKFIYDQLSGFLETK
jgi:hypothetical protein